MSKRKTREGRDWSKALVAMSQDRLADELDGLFREHMGEVNTTAFKRVPSDIHINTRLQLLVKVLNDRGVSWAEMGRAIDTDPRAVQRLMNGNGVWFEALCKDGIEALTPLLDRVGDK